MSIVLRLFVSVVLLVPALAQSGEEESAPAPQRLSHPELYGYGNDQDYPHMPACIPRSPGNPKGPKRCEFWKQEVTSLHTRLTARQARIDTLTAQVADLEEQLAANEQQRRMLLTGLAQKDTQLHRAKHDLEAAREQVLLLETENEDLDGMLVDVANGCGLFANDDNTDIYVEGAIIYGHRSILCVDVRDTFPKLSAALPYKGTRNSGVTVIKYTTISGSTSGYTLRHRGKERSARDWEFQLGPRRGLWEISASGYMTLISGGCSFNPSITCTGTSVGYTHPTEAQGVILKEMIEVLETLTFPTS